MFSQLVSYILLTMGSVTNKHYVIDSVPTIDQTGNASVKYIWNDGRVTISPVAKLFTGCNNCIPSYGAEKTTNYAVAGLTLDIVNAAVGTATEGKCLPQTQNQNTTCVPDAQNGCSIKVATEFTTKMNGVQTTAVEMLIDRDPPAVPPQTYHIWNHGQVPSWVFSDKCNAPRGEVTWEVRAYIYTPDANGNLIPTLIGSWDVVVYAQCNACPAFVN